MFSKKSFLGRGFLLVALFCLEGAHRSEGDAALSHIPELLPCHQDGRAQGTLRAENLPPEGGMKTHTHTHTHTHTLLIAHVQEGGC